MSAFTPTNHTSPPQSTTPFDWYFHSGGISDNAGQGYPTRPSKVKTEFPLPVEVALASVVLLAIVITSYLSFVSLTSSKIAGCGGGYFDCESVLQTKWSNLFGVPVGLFALALYTTLFGALMAIRFSIKPAVRMAASKLLTLGAVTAGVAAIWFIYLQVFQVQHLCVYCLAAHFCGLVLAAIVLISRPLPMLKLSGVLAVAAASVALLGLGQVYSSPPANYEIQRHDPQGESVFEPAPGTESQNQSGEPEIFEAPVVPDREPEPSEKSHFKNGTPLMTGWMWPHLSSAMLMIGPAHPGSTGQQDSAANSVSENTNSETTGSPEADEESDRRLIPILGGATKLDVAQWPLAGKQDAKYIFAEMFDYTCPHCRKSHRAVEGARSILGDDMAVLLLAIPLNSACNPTVAKDHPQHAESCELTRLAIAVWRVDASKFTTFHNWLMEGQVAPTAANARLQAFNLVDKEKLEAELKRTVVDAYLAKQVELYQKAQAGAVPKIFLPRSTIVGEYESAEGLVELLKQETDNLQKTDSID